MFGLFEESNKQPIYLYNSASKQKEEFQPTKPGTVTMYACGPTVYDHIHIGNLRAYLLPDLLHRLFLYNGYKVNFTINFTDFGHLSDDGDTGEDKIMKGMQAAGLPINIEAMKEFALPYIDSFKKDNEIFGNLPATTYARASNYIQEQIKLIETLDEKGYAYETSDGVYFDISKFPDYGTLGNIDLNQIRAGARVEVNEEKRHPADFALWKKGALGWESQWGVGFPGWHIECTAMIFATLGKQIDVHTGGEDLKYTHHNAEICQAESVTGKTFVKYWLHNAHITVSGEKIAKSTGNGLTLNDLEDSGYNPSDYRYWLLQSHYRTTTNFSLEALDAAKQALTRLKRFVYNDLDGIKPTVVNADYENKFVSALHDDLDTPKALAILWDLTKDESLKPGEKLATIHALDSLLEIGLSKESEAGKAELGYLAKTEVPEEIQDLLEQREAARIARNWPEADRLREAIRVKGFEVEDTAEGAKISQPK